MERTVVALYDNLDTAQAAVKELLDNGFSRDDISVVRTNQQGDYTSGNADDPNANAGDASGIAAGAGIGAVLGGLAGLLVGLGALAIPGIGPIIAAGPIATTLAGAGLGAATGGLVGALADVGIPESEAGYYAEGVRRGGTLVTVRAGEDTVSRATEVMNRFAPVDINQRAGQWQSSGWSGFDANAGPYSTRTGAPHTGQYAGEGTDKGNTDYRAQAGMTGENSGGTYEGAGSAGYTGSGTTYQGSGSFTSNTEAGVDAPRQSTPADRDSVMSSGHGEMSTSQGFSGQGGGTYERMQDADSKVHPRSSEGDYQARRDFLGGDESMDDEGGRSAASYMEGGMIETGRGTYGSQGQDFEPNEGSPMEGQLGGHQGSLAGGESFTPNTGGTNMGVTGTTFRTGGRFDDYDRDFRSDWEANYRETGYGYDRYQPAYQYGWQLGSRYQGRDWSDFETDARTDWERNHPNDAWQDFKSAIRRGWERVASGAESAAANLGQGSTDTGRETSRDLGQNFGQGTTRDFDAYDRDFRTDWERAFRSTGFGYERYQPAYQYGYAVGSEPRYRGRQWNDVEADVRRDWEQRHPNDAWEDFKDAVRHAWEHVRTGIADATD